MSSDLEITLFYIVSSSLIIPRYYQKGVMTPILLKLVCISQFITLLGRHGLNAIDLGPSVKRKSEKPQYPLCLICPKTM